MKVTECVWCALNQNIVNLKVAFKNGYIAILDSYFYVSTSYVVHGELHWFYQNNLEWTYASKK